LKDAFNIMDYDKIKADQRIYHLVMQKAVNSFFKFTALNIMYESLAVHNQIY